MQAYIFERLGAGLEGLALRDRAEPQPGPHEVVVDIHARSVNNRDLRILDGIYPVAGRPGAVALSDGAGEVVAVGEAVSRFAVGDRVAATYFPAWIDGPFSLRVATDQFGCTRDGMLAELTAVHENALVKLPEHLSFEEGAALPCAGLTAWSALIGPRPILPGESVLTIGTGGVAIFALQFAKLFGATVVSITSSDAKAQRLRELGADEVINYVTTPDWDRAVRERTGGRGVEHVVETGSIETLARSVASTAEGGVVTFIAALTDATFDPRCLFNPIMLRRTYVGSRTGFEAMNRAISANRLQPVISRAFEFGEAKDAYRYFASRKQIGKVVITGG